MWLKMMSVLMMMTAETGAEWYENHEEEAASGYVVVESVDDDIVVLEAEGGTIEVPRNWLPGSVLKEGNVLVWHVSGKERARRLLHAQLRIERMQENQ